jgi:protein SSD1
LLRSAAKLSYENAQDVLEGRALGNVPVAVEHAASDIAHDIKVLQSLAEQMRARRFKNGALALEQPRIAFELDASGRPVDCGSYERRDAHKLIEEVRVAR